MRKSVLPFAVVVLYGALCGSASAGPDETVERRGLRCISESAFPVPAGAEAIPLPGGDFETDGAKPPGWAIGGGEILAGDDAPQGRAYCRLPARKGSILRTPQEIEGRPGTPHFLSFWLKSPAKCWAAINFGSDEQMRTFGNHYPGIPETGNQWRRVGYYFWMPAQCRTVCFQIQPQNEGVEGQFISVDDFQLRTAGEAEMSAAYEHERLHLPAHDVTPRPGDGRNLALSVAKWEGRAGLPGKPFLIWAVGSSWTNFQGDGYPLIRAIRQRFPDAPPIVYKKHAGSGTPWDYARGWVRQFVIADQPDLVFTYTNGTPEGLDALLTEVRRHTTADVIVPSLHFFERSTLTPKEINSGVVPWDEIREICRKHDAEFVENRRELAEYLQRIGEEPPTLVGDAVHQNQHGRIRIWDNICRHVARLDEFSYAPETRERRVPVVPATSTGTEQVTVCGPWTAVDKILRTAEKDARLTFRFTGNRIDLIGRKTPGGGTARVFIDGAAADEAAAFYTGYIRPQPKVWPRVLQGPGPGDVAPHAVELRQGVVPQTWTITMTSDSGDYRIDGSVSGFDGEGNVAEPFVSRSGQIGIDPRLWRHGRIERKGKPVMFGNGAGDTFTFDVYRCAAGTISFRAEAAEPLCVPLVQNLSNAEHVLEVVAAGDGEICVEAFYVFQPPLQN